MTNTYESVYQSSLQDPATFWAAAADQVHWYKKWERVLDDSNPPFYRWFVGGQVNTCYNAVDLHVEQGRGEQPAIIYDSPVTGATRVLTYSEMQTQTSLCAGMLAARGVGHGDRVIIYMPMVPEALIAMLACARLGAVHSVVFGGFASNELAVRIDDCTPTAIVSASCGIEPGRVVEYKPLLDAAIEMAQHKPDSCIIVQRPECLAELVEGRDHDWHETMAVAEPRDCVPVAATDPLYILYTSGTTGQPKGVVRDNAGHIVALKWSMQNIYGAEPGDVYWAASDVGWVVGHSYIVYAPLFNGNTTVLYEGKPVGTPDPGAFWRVISEHKVKVLFTAPTAFRAIKKEDPSGEYLKQYDMSNFDCLYLAGERTDPDTLHWAEEKLGVPVIDHWWQTETGWSIAANCRGIEMLPVKEGSPSKAVPGWDLKVLDANGASAPPGEIGTLAVKLPLPPGSFPELWNARERFVEAYLSQFAGYYNTSDAGIIDADGYVYVMSRTDDIINVAGHRLSTGAMEEVLADHPDVAECAVTGIQDALKGQVPLGFLVLNAGCERDLGVISAEVVQMVRDRIGPVAAFKQAVVVNRLPKTRSGKILRGVMRNIADGEEWRMPPTIDDPAILDEISEALGLIGLPAP
ncbi:MAG TPA: propionyl-CoA synthetase [Arenicellales bacterium]|jgi:propionyl-CoA synthetase|nr:propionyl-CoA synthetase [Acidiferrobacteraceae bacterium]MDP6136966.1 propionyl-CoA synthetase [Arenicellales bacterium]HCF74623.1 propionyl-CoA synthetase [Gammaproteobacteria bacterium]HJP08752.1 propionyl-CoA synthetase [Arenicellales bacterium]|tara:strand:+ start:1437 stop:3335 length:1899 start_codon:yes stop_codon:yes gene_type:complete